MKLRVLALLALLCVSTAASAKKRILPMPLAEKLPVEVVLSQQEIAIDTPDNSVLGSQFGLLGAIVETAISNSQAAAAEKRAANVRNLLIDYDFNRRFEAAIRAKIASEGISPSPELVVRDTPWDAYSANRPAKLEESAANGAPPPTGIILSISPRYALSYTMQNMYVTMSVVLADRQPKGNGKYKQKVLATRAYTFDFPLNPSYGKTPEINIDRWKAIGGSALGDMLDLAVDQVTDMFVYDMSAAGRSEGEKPVKKEFGQFQGLKTFGRQLREGDSWYWIRPGKYSFDFIRGVNPLETNGPTSASAAKAAPATEVQATSDQSGPAPGSATANGPEPVQSSESTSAQEAAPASAPASGESSTGANGGSGR